MGVFLSVLNTGDAEIVKTGHRCVGFKEISTIITLKFIEKEYFHN
jgi:hypothetical protein